MIEITKTRKRIGGGVEWMRKNGKEIHDDEIPVEFK